MNHSDSWPIPNTQRREQALLRQASLTKPPGALGRLEALAVELSGQQNRERPAVDRVWISLFAADHGVCAENISAFPQAVTAQMVANFAAGGAAISVLARDLDASLEVINAGVCNPLPSQDGVRNTPVASGTGNMTREMAMNEAQRAQALTLGDEAAERAHEQGAELFIGGEMGIGNTTSASAVACSLLAADPADLAGPGTGLDAAGVSHKAEVVRVALSRHGANREPMSVLQSLGGLEIAALTGAILGCAKRGIPVLVDGFIVSVAALVACRHEPRCRDWLHFAHRSGEPGHGRILEALEADPLLDLAMRLGEGSGAAVAVPLMRQACVLHNEMASFEDANVSNRD